MRKRDMSSSWDRIIVIGAFTLGLYRLVPAARAFTRGQLLSGTYETLFALTIAYLGISQLYELDGYHPINVVGNGICVIFLMFFVLSLFRSF
ncbi:MAG: hypothetical protein AVDCRST_MAG86-3665 [uncultured Truepera sp.]|uniref:Uncharacterized protein n=1 Tax=uncultured Truepera sp. TaxID=543023 RepID=A0A6J4VTV9_9DEIN|nr:MAG: hypothetical protein AVDCRST_MAG86-3665 [uncultured Truepera sp.]